uniref:M.mazei ORF94 near the dnaK locus, contiguous with the trkA protein n=1 Tax=Methanosarcina mazei TaxID=2209 RepID=Q50240_METMZ|nr:unnamed protein product [Methanosarcina mazei]
MINTLRNFALIYHHVSGINLNPGIKRGIFFIFNLALLSLVLISSGLTAFTAAIFCYSYFYFSRYYTVQSYAGCFSFRNPCSGGFIDNSFFEGVL